MAISYLQTSPLDTSLPSFLPFTPTHSPSLRLDLSLSSSLRSLPLYYRSIPLFCAASKSSTNTNKNASDDLFLRKKLAVFVSGGGSNFQKIHEASLENRIYGDIHVVVSDKPACKACDYARSNNISVIEYPKSKFAEGGLSSDKLVTTLRQNAIDFIILAGYLKLLPGELVQAYPRSILNIHPALLPAFGGKGYYGRKVHEAVIKSGARFSGPTIHFIDEIYDNGVILAQRIVPVLPYDTADELAARVLKEEHQLYPEVIAALCEDRIFWREDGVPLIRRSWNDADYY